MANTDMKRWSTPRLRVFVRTNTEETVLVTCKTPPPGTHGPDRPNCKYQTNLPCVTMSSS